MKSISQYYLNIFRENKRWFWGSFLVLGVFAAVGHNLGQIFPGLIEGVFSIFEEKFGGRNLEGWGLAWAIFSNNVKAILIALFGGVVLGIMPFISLASNGAILGIFSNKIFTDFGLGKGFVFLGLGILPHGIIELPVFVLAAALGVRLGLEWIWAPSLGKSRGEVWVSNFKTNFLVLPLLVLFLLIAAVVEVFVTGWMLG